MQGVARVASISGSLAAHPHLAALAGRARCLDGDSGVVEAIILKRMLQGHGAVASHSHSAGHLRHVGGQRRSRLEGMVWVAEPAEVGPSMALP